MFSLSDRGRLFLRKSEVKFYHKTKISACYQSLVLCSVMSDSLQPHALYVDHQAPLSMEFSRQAYWSGLSFSSSGDLPDPGLEPASLASPALAPGKPLSMLFVFIIQNFGSQISE